MMRLNWKYYKIIWVNISAIFYSLFLKNTLKNRKRRKMLELQYKKNNAPLEQGKIIKKINGDNLKFDLSKKVREV